jgi:hypothetical protein
MQTVGTLQQTFVPIILMVAGILFIFFALLGVLGTLSSRRIMGIVGTGMLLMGIALSTIPINTKVVTPPLPPSAATTTATETQPTNQVTVTVQQATQAPVPTRIELPTSPDLPTSTATASLACSANLLSHPWHLEATNDADEESEEIKDPNILKGRDTLRVTYNLHGLMAQEGVGKNDSAIIFNQPNWYVASLSNPKYSGQNGLDREQTVNIPLSDFIGLPDTQAGIPGGKLLDLNKPVSAIRARFWHHDHFNVDITYIAVCTSQK